MFHSPRNGGMQHTGVDIVAVLSSSDREQYAVKAVHDGKVVYSALNSTAVNPGYGYTIVVDHLDGAYSVYAHLAKVASTGVAPVGADVKAGQTIGYMADPAKGEISSGNVVDCKVLPYEKYQLHFELILVAKRPASVPNIGALTASGVRVDPTTYLKAAGLGEYPPPTAKEQQQKHQQCAAAAAADN
jgi:murein DD-endopeptidase MepM/ murein hydrolase activator NlpD